MKDEDKTKEQLIQELKELRQRINGLEVSEVERQRTEEALRESEKRFRLITENIREVFYICDPELNEMFYVSPAYEEIWGRTCESLYKQPKSFLSSIHPEDRERMLNSLDDHLPEKSTAKEYRILRPDGTIRWISDLSFPVCNEQGQVYLTTGITEDITKRKQAEEELRKTKDHLDNIINSSLDCIVVSDRKGNVTKVNKYFLELFGYREEEIVGKHLSEYTPMIEEGIYESITGKLVEIDEKHVDDANKMISRLISAGRITNWETYYFRKDRKVIPVEQNIMFLSNEEKERTGAVAIIRDITERKKAEEERQYLLNELKDKNKEIEQLVYIASHDLRSPLVNVQGFSKELESTLKQIHTVINTDGVPLKVKEELAPYLEEDIPDALQYILTSVSKMDSLLSALLHLSRLGREALNIKHQDMNKLIGDTVKAFEFQIKEAGVTLDIDKLPSCVCDEIQINQVFSNLLDNALKYSDPNRTGSIRIAGRKENGRAIYCVQDNGIGIAPEHQNKIYEIFQRLNPTATPGEGLGLTIARRILDRQAGKIWVESDQGKGSTFFVSLPTN